MLKKNDIVELNIDGMTNLGFGVGHIDGMAVFIASGVTGDRVLAKIIKLSSSYAVGRIEKILEYSLSRCEGRCHIKECTACAYKSISYQAELQIKKSDIEAFFRKAGLPHIEILDPIASPKLSEYRNKAQYPISVSKNGEYTVGFYAPKTHRVKEARECPLTPPVFADIINTLVEFFKKHKLSTYCEETGKGLLRHIYLRQAELSREIMLTLVINGTAIPDVEELASKLKERHKSIRSFVLNENTSKTNVILGKKSTVIYGDGKISDTLCGVRLMLTHDSFYQVNHSAAELLYAKARELASPQSDDTVLDLYCGVGSIGLSMADTAGKIIGIEIVDAAVQMAKTNAEINGFTSSEFHTGDATNAKKLLENAERERGEKIKPDIVILDPPRGGSSEELIEFVTELSPRKAIYISCNPATLARDVKIFEKFGYYTDKIQPVDLFPATGHCEAVCALYKK